MTARFWLTALALGCAGAGPACAQDALPAKALLQEMSPGWNLGNTLEAIGKAPAPAEQSQETAWGNPPATQALFDAVKAAGFRSVRIPVAWAQYADAQDRISPAWMARVKQVVGFARKAGLTVMINVHWDGGWLQPTYADQARANARLKSFWTQIATALEDQDAHVLFAGTNEVLVKDVYSAPTKENCAVQNGFNQVFVDAVRATGGSNATRMLVVQGYNTNIDHTIACNATLPTDPAKNRLAMEVHYYDPYDFALNTDSKVWQWGSIATDPKATANWGGEDHADRQFAKIKGAFVDKGVPVILGEYGASLRTEVDKAGTYRSYWDRFVTGSAHRHGLVPVYWDNGYTSNHNMGLFDRAAAKPAFPETIAGIVEAAK